MKGKLVLASVSPRRIELLKSLGLSLFVVPSGVDESFIKGESPEDHVRRLSREKAQAVSADYPDDWVLGADTIVVSENEILGKPVTRSDARRMLAMLSGRNHTVFTGYAIMKRNGDILFNDVVESTVLFKTIPEDEIAWYIRTEEPYDKAGGYAVQGMGAFFIREIRGSYTNVMGLPLCEVVDVLKRIGAIGFNGG